MEYTLTDIFKILLKHLLIILLCTVLGAGGTFAVSKYVLDKEYTATVSMYAARNSENADIYTSLTDLNYAQQVVNTYIVILKTNDFLGKVVRQSGLEYSLGELKGMVTMNPINDTEVFEIHVTSKVPEDSLILANTIVSLAPQKIAEIKSADDVKAVDPAILPTEPSSPNILLNTAMGFVLGIVLGILVAFLRETLNKRVKDEDDLLLHYNVPILGMIPTMTVNKEGC